jgi:hypothetical protein
MIGFFRRIRKKLADDNKPFKYLRYAIGEIVLVVIGILIALQINNWNQNRIERLKEFEILQDLSNELKSDLKFNLWTLELNNQSRKSMEIIRNSLETNLPYHDSLSKHFSLSTFIVYPQLNGSVFETLKSEGLDLISNKTLRDSIVRTYGWRKLWISDQKDSYKDFMMDAAKNTLNTRFHDFWNADMNKVTNSRMIPLNYESLKTDQKYLYLIKSLLNLNYFYIDWPFQETITDINNLLRILEKELDNDKK